MNDKEALGKSTGRSNNRQAGKTAASAKTALRRQDIISKPIGQQLVKLTLPMLYAIVAIMGLGLIDSYFISYLGTEQLAAIGFIVPVAGTVTSFGLGLGMAISSLTSKLIGAEKISSAARLVTDGFYLTGVVALLTVLVLIWQLDNIFTSIGADNSTLNHIHNYMITWVIAAPLMIYTMVCSSTLRAIGDTAASARIAIAMTLSNLILDPLLIFGIGPFPELGMQGAALATVIAVAISAAIGFHYLAVKEHLLLWARPAWFELKLNLRQLLDIAIPALLANAIVPLTATMLTALVAVFGNDAVAGYGVGVRVEAISMLVIYALSSTLPMFIGQNLGAGRKDRVYQAIRGAFRFILILQFGIFLLLILGAESIANLFSEDPTVKQTITTFLWIVPLSYGLSGVVVLINVAVNVLGKPRLALYINVIRLVLFYFPLAYFGSHWFGLKGLFAGIALGNCCAYVLATVMLNKTLTELGINQEDS